MNIDHAVNINNLDVLGLGLDKERPERSVVDGINRINSILIEKSRGGSLDRSSGSFRKSKPVGLKKQHSEGVANVFSGGGPGGQVGGYQKDSGNS